MELEELKDHRHVIKAPAESSGGLMQTSNNKTNGLIEMLKVEDARQLTALKRARPFWWIAAALWVFSSVGILLTQQASSQQIDPGFPLRASLALVFSGLAAAMYFQIRKMSVIDYTEPATLFLRRAARRYEFMSAPYFVLSILVTAVLALVASVYIVDVFQRYLDVRNPSIGLVATFAFVALVYLFGYSVSKKAWKRTRGPMLDQIMKMQADLHSESR